MLAWHLGLRYLRRRRASWLALASVALTVAVSVATMGITHAWLEIAQKQVRANQSDLTALDGGWVTDSPGLRERLLSTPGVRASSPFIETYALVVPRGPDHRPVYAAAVPCEIDGFDWQADSGLGRFPPRLLHASPVFDLRAPPLPSDQRGTAFLTPAWRDRLALIGLDAVAGLGAAPLPPSPRPLPGVIVGREMAYLAGHSLWPGREVQIVVPSAGSLSGGRLNAEIADILASGVYETDRVGLLMPLPLAQRVTGRDQGERGAQVTGYRLGLHAGIGIDAGKDAVEASTGLYAQTWMTRRGGSQVKALEQQRNLMLLVMLLIQLLAVFIVFAVFSTLVAEKRHDIGVLLGIGATRAAITAAFLIASVVSCVLGGLIGWGLGWAFLAGINPFSRWSGFEIFPQAVFYSADTPISFDLRFPLLFVGVMGAVGLLAAAWPAWRAGRIEPVAILRESG